MRHVSVKLFFLFQIISIALIAFDLLPREFSFILTGIFLIYISISTLEESLLITIASIPLYVALPISANLDSMASWRIVILALLVKWMLQSGKFKAKSLNFKKINLTPLAIKNFLLYRLDNIEILGIVFLGTALVSLVGAISIGIGIKKIIFLANIFLLYILIKYIADTREKIVSVIKISFLAVIFILFAGYLQLFAVFFVSLYDFWQYWAGNVVPIFYGDNLARLLSQSNTWFSYYGNGIPPTLRMFSVFPDSHSFALFNIISIPFSLALAAYFKRAKEMKKYLAAIFVAILSLFAIVLSGSRGAWVGAITPIVFSVIVIIASKLIKNNIAGEENGSAKKSAEQNGNPYAEKLKIGKFILNSKKFFLTIPKTVLFTFLLFFLLFPVSSLVLDQSQKAEFYRLNNTSGAKYGGLTFKRFASVTDVTETSNKGRIEIWKDTLNSIKKHPVLGVGFGNFPIVLEQDLSTSKKGASAHNIYLDLWAETGIIGLIVFVLIFYEIGKTSYRIFKNSTDPVFRIFGAAFGVYLIWIMGYGMFDVVLFNDKVLMMFTVGLGILYGIKNLKKIP